MKPATLLLFLLFGSLTSIAQEISGIVTDYKREPLIGVSVHLTQAGISINDTLTDDCGKYTLKSLRPGYYNITFSYKDHCKKTIVSIPIFYQKSISLETTMDSAKSRQQSEITIDYQKPIISCRGLWENPVRPAEINRKPVHYSWRRRFIDKMRYTFTSHKH